MNRPLLLRHFLDCRFQRAVCDSIYRHIFARFHFHRTPGKWMGFYTDLIQIHRIFQIDDLAFFFHFLKLVFQRFQLRCRLFFYCRFQLRLVFFFHLIIFCFFSGCCRLHNLLCLFGYDGFRIQFFGCFLFIGIQFLRKIIFIIKRIEIHFKIVDQAVKKALFLRMICLFRFLFVRFSFGFFGIVFVFF